MIHLIKFKLIVLKARVRLIKIAFKLKIAQKLIKLGQFLNNLEVKYGKKTSEKYRKYAQKYIG